MGLSENVGLIFPMIASHFSWRDNDQQNHWVQWGLAYFQTHLNDGWAKKKSESHVAEDLSEVKDWW